MDSGIRVLEDSISYRPLGDTIDAAASDDSRLKQLGYKQELNRTLSAIASFSVTFTIVSILTGLTTTFGTGLTYGGPVTMVYGWPIVGLLTLVVGSAMAEICSAYPTSGGLYFWSAKLCGNEWGPFASWLTGCNDDIIDLGGSTKTVGNHLSVLSLLSAHQVYIIGGSV